MKKKPLTPFTDLIAFRGTPQDKAALDAVARRWQLNPTEVARRAFREGLVTFKKIDLPGTGVVEQQK